MRCNFYAGIALASPACASSPSPLQDLVQEQGGGGGLSAAVPATANWVAEVGGVQVEGVEVALAGAHTGVDEDAAPASALVAAASAAAAFVGGAHMDPALDAAAVADAGVDAEMQGGGDTHMDDAHTDEPHTNGTQLDKLAGVQTDTLQEQLHSAALAAALREAEEAEAEDVQAQKVMYM